MKSELQTLKEIVHTLIRHQENPETLILLIQEGLRLPDAITANTFTLSTDQQIRDYLFWQQDQLIKEADLLYKACLEAPRRILRKGLVVILGVLKALKRMFPRQFDNTLPLPQAEYLKKKTHYQEIYRQLSENFKSGNIGPQLTEIALYPLTWFAHHSGQARYCDEQYLSHYAPVLLKLSMENLQPAVAAELLCSRLLTLNYNSLAFYDFLTTRIRVQLDSVPRKKDKELLLKRLKIKLKPIPVTAGIVFDPNFLSLKEAMLEWAELEQEALALLPDAPKKAGVAQGGDPFKLTCSVAVLAYFTRLCKIHRVFPKERQHAEVLDHMVAVFCTKETSRMSRSSFYNCYKAPKTNTARALRKVLRPFLEDIDYLINNGEVRDDKDKP